MTSKMPTPGLPRITFHAAARYRGRVEDHLSNEAVQSQIKRILATGARSGPGRGWWADYVSLPSGYMLIEDPLHPGVALVVGHGVVVTVITDWLVGATDREEGDDDAQH